MLNISTTHLGASNNLGSLKFSIKIEYENNKVIFNYIFIIESTMGTNLL